MLAALLALQFFLHCGDSSGRTDESLVLAFAPTRRYSDQKIWPKTGRGKLPLAIHVSAKEPAWFNPNRLNFSRFN
jgi:hypothetical protein